MSRDPVGLGGGANRYAYLGGVPLLGRDPMGLRPIDPATLSELSEDNPMRWRPPLGQGVTPLDTLRNEQRKQAILTGAMVGALVIITPGIYLAGGTLAVLKFAGAGMLIGVPLGVARSTAISSSRQAALADGRSDVEAEIAATRTGIRVDASLIAIGGMAGLARRAFQAAACEAGASSRTAVAAVEITEVGETVAAAAERPVDIARRVISGLDEALFENLQCEECATAIIDALRANGVSGRVIRIQARGGADFIASDLYQGGATAISRNGKHAAVLIEDVVFDNLNPKGVSHKSFVESLFARLGLDFSYFEF